MSDEDEMILNALRDPAHRQRRELTASLFKRWERRLLGYAKRYRSELKDAPEDICQQWIVKVFTKADTYSGGGASAWLWQIFIYLLIDNLRSNNKNRNRTTPFDERLHDSSASISHPPSLENCSMLQRHYEDNIDDVLFQSLQTLLPRDKLVLFAYAQFGARSSWPERIILELESLGANAGYCRTIYSRVKKCLISLEEIRKLGSALGYRFPA